VELLFILIVVFAVVALFVLKNKKTSTADDKPWPYYAKKPLTQPEQVLYHRLVSAMPECIVLAQVQLSQVLGVKKGFKFNEWNNRINRMSLDYLVCLKDSTIVAAVELDEKSHEKQSRIEADKKKNKALSDAGITIIRWNVSDLPDEEKIRLSFTASQNASTS
jgi:very-short-patch-repair endonuclease